MSPCCLAAAAATAALTALIVVGLSAFVLVTDGFGLGLLVGTLLAVALQRAGRIGPCPDLLYALSGLLVGRAAWLLATSRRSLVVTTWRHVRPRAHWVVVNLTPVRLLRQTRNRRPHAAANAVPPPVVYQIGRRPEQPVGR
jgi:hypothetical protein